MPDLPNGPARNGQTEGAGIPAPNVLVVDLDGGLLRSDIAYESFWAGLSDDWRALPRLLKGLAQGPQELRRQLARSDRTDPATLPYNPAVLDYIRDWRARGGRTALVTGRDRLWAEKIAAALGLFDEVHGAAPGLDLGPASKPAWLVEHFGAGRFAYLGRGRADLPNWQNAGLIVTLDSSAALDARLGELGPPVVRLTREARVGPPAILRALRPHQWLKNLLVFVPMLAAHEIGAVTIGQTTLAFVAFCLVASSVYIVNDLFDLRADRNHPRKRLRPFASGAVAIPTGMATALTLILAGLAIGHALGPKFFAALLFYSVTTAAYSLIFKRRLVIDICLLAGLYTVRILGGGFATGISLTVWLLGLSVFFFFSLAAVKRQAELVDSRIRGAAGASGRGYQVEDLPIVSTMAVAAGYVSVLIMALYVNQPQVVQFYSYPKALWGICPIMLYWLSRMVMVTHRGEMNDDPLVFAARDGTSLLCLGLTGVCMVAASIVTV